MLRVVLVVSLLSVFSAAASAAQTPSLAERVELQATMQRYIDRHLVDGAFLDIDPKTDTVRVLYPVAPHPEIISVGRYFILCADFRDKDGKAVNIDFYVVRKKGRFLIFQTQVEQRDRLSGFLKSPENRR